MLSVYALLAVAGGGFDPKSIVWNQSVKGLYEATATIPTLQGTITGDLAQKAEIKFVKASIQEIIAGAKADQKQEGKLRNPYSLEIKPEETYRTPRLTSSMLSTYKYTGGAHGIAFYSAFNYSAIEGPAREIKTADLFAKGSDWTRDVTFAIFSKIRSNEAAAWVQNGDIRELKSEDLQKVFISADGLTFYFDPYALGSWADGPMQIKLSIAELGPNFKRGWLLQR